MNFGRLLSPSTPLFRSKLFTSLPEKRHKKKHLRLPSVVFDVTSSSDKKSASSSSSISLPPLRCPGGPRLKAEGHKHLFKVPHAGYLAKYDERFILNLKLTHQIVSQMSKTTLRTNDKLLLELGPGAGSLTRSLLTRPCVGVLGVERDERFNPHLEQVKNFTEGKFMWVNADVLQVNELDLIQETFPNFLKRNQRHPPFDKNSETLDQEDAIYEGAPLRSKAREGILRKRFHRLDDDGNTEKSFASNVISDKWWSDGDAKVEVIANLPFSIITELLMRYAVDCSRHQNIFSFGRVPLHVFTQHEIAERIMAPAGSIHFSRLSVLCQAYFHVHLQRTFTEMTYYPRTEVLGAMLTLDPRTSPVLPGLDAAVLINFTNLLMKPGNRGKTIFKALVQFTPPEVAQYMLQESSMDGAMTVLDLNVKEITALAGMWYKFLQASQQADSYAPESNTDAASNSFKN